MRIIEGARKIVAVGSRLIVGRYGCASIVVPPFQAGIVANGGHAGGERRRKRQRLPGLHQQCFIAQQDINFALIHLETGGIGIHAIAPGAGEAHLKILVVDVHRSARRGVTGIQNGCSCHKFQTRVGKRVRDHADGGILIHAEHDSRR